MSRSFKIALIMKSRSALPLYQDLRHMSESELDEHVLTILRRMNANESRAICRMRLEPEGFSLN